jgi:hypothetical protein
MTPIRWWMVVGIALAASLAMGIRGSMPAALGAVTIALAAWALLSFFQWRRMLRPRHGSTGAGPTPPSDS